VIDQHDRNVESIQTDDTRYERALDEETRRRHEAAERLKRDAVAEPDGASEP
jgi:hypothetical protein